MYNHELYKKPTTHSAWIIYDLVVRIFFFSNTITSSPVRMYWSRMAEYSSCPAVSRMSSRQVSPSITTWRRTILSLNDWTQSIDNRWVRLEFHFENTSQHSSLNALEFADLWWRTKEYLFPVAILDSGVVLLDEVILDELNCERRLAHASIAHDH